MPPFFADAEATDRAMTTASLILAGLSLLANGVFGWLRNRDALRFNEERIRLESRFEIQESQRESNARTILRMEKEVADCHRERDETKARLERMEKELREEIRELRDRQDFPRPRARGDKS